MEQNRERTLFLNGVIAEESWFDDDVTPRLFKDELMAGCGDITVWINSPMTVAMGDTAEMQKAIEMLGSVKDSIINAYEIKTGLSRAKPSHLMDAETWMDANKAVELGFADGILSRRQSEDEPLPAGSMLYSPAAAVNSLMDKIAAKCRIHPKETEDSNPKGRSVDSLMERLNLLKQ